MAFSVSWHTLLDEIIDFEILMMAVESNFPDLNLIR